MVRAKPPTPWKTYAKMALGGGILCIGGPALVMWVTPTEEELFKRYNPELQKRSLENRYQKQKDFDDFVNRLKEYSKDDRPIWEVQAEAEKLRKKAAMLKPGGREAMMQESDKPIEMQLADKMLQQKQELRKDGPLVPGGSL